MATAPANNSGILEIATPRVFLPLLTPHKRYRGGKGGRASGKSHFFAELLVETCIMRPGLRALAAREVQKSLKDSAKKLIEDKIEALGVGSRFEVLQTEIRTPGGGVILFAGLRDHTVDSIKSMEGIDVAWLEEAETISERSLTLLEPTIRKEDSEIWLSWNPRRRSAPVERLIPWQDEDVAVLVHANYKDNPFLSQTVRDMAARHLRDNPESYPHVWLGAYEDAGARTVIPPLWIDSAVGLAKRLGIVPTGRRRAALDVAGAEEGGDENGFVVQHGIEICHIEKWNGFDTSETTQRSAKLAVEHGCDNVQYDSAGVGEGVTGEWAAMGRRDEQPDGLTFTAWNGGMSVLEPDARIDPDNPKSPTNKDHYHNLKAQAHFRLRRRFHEAHKANTGQPYDPDYLISISEDIPARIRSQFCDELAQPEQKLSGTGKVMIDKAPDGARSPNIGDPAVMLACPIETKAGYTPLWG